MSEKKDQCRVTKKDLETAAKELSVQLDYEKNPTAYLDHLSVPNNAEEHDEDLHLAAIELNRELASEREAEEQKAIAADYSLDPESYLGHLSAPHILPGISSDPDFSTASYAAFVRLYMEWMEMSEDEQIKFAEKNVEFAGKKHKEKAQSSEGILFNRSGHEMYGEDFDAYRNEAWASQAERFADVDAFALYLEQNLKRYGKFPMSRDILRRAAQNMMENMRKQQIKRSDALSIDETCQDDDGKEIEIQIPDHSESVENIVELKDTIDHFRSLLKAKPVRQRVFDFLLAQYLKNEIADNLHISPPAVSRHVKNIHALYDSIR